MKLLDELHLLLRKDERLVSNDEFLKNRTVEFALKLDKDLIKLLLSNKKVKEHFFEEVDKILIFDREKFMKFINNKKFLPDSYTAFTNIMGLTADKNYIARSKEVVLSWLYKDCILEGGQTKEDQKRDEIFFNQILEQDEIDILLDPKVLTNFKRYTAKGQENVSQIRRDKFGTIKENFIIKGNNLLALHTLKEQFKGKIKLIYIDPPYNTGSDSFNYNDNFNHSTWLTFMKNRLDVAKELLSDDGSIFVQIGHNEHAYLKILMDEIFGRDRFVNEIAWKKYGGVKNQASKKLTTQHETLLFYSKTQNFTLNRVYNPISEKYVKHEYKYIDHNGRSYAKLRGRKYQGGDKTTKIKYLDENPGSPITTLWDEKKLQLNTSSAEKIKNFVGQKPETLLQRIIELCSSEGDIVLDYHLGSGTTCAVAHKMKRRYIGIEQLDYGKDSAVVRLKNVIGKLNGKGKPIETIEDFGTTGISKVVNWRGGGEFVYCELAEFNEQFIKKIKKVRNSKELLRIWKEMKESAFLSYRVDDKLFEDNIKEFRELPVEQQKKLLVECLDSNNLYINYSEIRDKQYKVSKEDIELNTKFYRRGL